MASLRDLCAEFLCSQDGTIFDEQALSSRQVPAACAAQLAQFATMRGERNAAALVLLLRTHPGLLSQLGRIDLSMCATPAVLAALADSQTVEAPVTVQLDFTGADELTDDTLRALLCHDRVKALRIGSLVLKGCTAVTDSSLFHIGHLEETLTDLDVSNCPLLTDAALCRAAQSCTNLVSLNIKNTLASDNTVAAVLECCPRLQNLVLTGVLVSNEPFMHLKPGNQLRVLIWKRNIDAVCLPLSDATLQRIAQNCPHLQQLVCVGSDAVTEAPLTALAKGCPDLQYVDLSACANAQYSADSISSQFGQRLSELHLDGARIINDDYAPTVEAILPRCGASLRKLVVRYAFITVEGLQCVSQHCHNLEELELVKVDGVLPALLVQAAEANRGITHLTVDCQVPLAYVQPLLDALPKLQRATFGARWEGGGGDEVEATLTLAHATLTRLTLLLNNVCPRLQCPRLEALHVRFHGLRPAGESLASMLIPHQLTLRRLTLDGNISACALPLDHFLLLRRLRLPDQVTVPALGAARRLLRCVDVPLGKQFPCERFVPSLSSVHINCADCIGPREAAALLGIPALLHLELVNNFTLEELHVSHAALQTFELTNFTKLRLLSFDDCPQLLTSQLLDCPLVACEAAATAAQQSTPRIRRITYSPSSGSSLDDLDEVPRSVARWSITATPPSVVALCLIKAWALGPHVSARAALPHSPCRRRRSRSRTQPPS
eukprot:TRINITY_DN3126_c0_g1_i4.p1 TRINITY_DN3126_c0_g1~~TRINITY_DN3126_c0_g1_i4.p1  ORF type:complete len:722 (-),score=166.29 TRINITY_DN3126_c0_g1_i4:470-2635(-)